jgi:hypothetical protein
MLHVPGTFWNQASSLITSLRSPLSEPRAADLKLLLLLPSQLAILTASFPAVKACQEEYYVITSKKQEAS